MALEMKRSCERCHCPLAMDAEAFICSFECTWCASCYQHYDGVCPNCGGELLLRPKRRVSREDSGELTTN